MTRDTDYPRAVHEAGHAIIGRVLDMTGAAVSICGPKDFAQSAVKTEIQTTQQRWNYRGRFRNRACVEHARILTFMAGSEAESMFCGGASNYDCDDRWQIAMMIHEEAIGGQVGQLESKLRRWSRVLCKRHQSAISIVASALERDGSLSVSQIDKLFA
jgi:hypothetical protein